MKKLLKKMMTMALAMTVVFGSIPYANAIEKKSGIDERMRKMIESIGCMESTSFYDSMISDSSFLDFFSVKAAATDATDEDSETLKEGMFEFQVDDKNEATVTGLVYEKITSEIIIPEKLGDFPVVAVDPSALDLNLFSTLDDSFEFPIIKSIHLSKNIRRFSNRSLLWSLERITVDSDNEFFSSIDGILYNKEGTDLIWYPAAKKADELEINNTISSAEDFKIVEYALANGATINELKLSDNFINSLYAFLFASFENPVQGITDAPYILGISDKSEYADFYMRCIVKSVVTEKFSVSDSNQYLITDEQGVLYNKDKTTLLKYPLISKETVYTIPETVNLSKLNGVYGRSLIGLTNSPFISMPGSYAQISLIWLGLYSEMIKSIPANITEEDLLPFKEKVKHFNVIDDAIRNSIKIAPEYLSVHVPSVVIDTLPIDQILPNEERDSGLMLHNLTGAKVCVFAENTTVKTYNEQAREYNEQHAVTSPSNDDIEQAKKELAGLGYSEEAIDIYISSVLPLLPILQETSNCLMPVNEIIICGGQHDNSGSGGEETPELKSGLSVFTNNTSLSYSVGDVIVLAVSQIESNGFSVPEKLAVAVSNDSVAAVSNIVTYGELANSDSWALKTIANTLPEELRNCSFVLMTAKGEGTTTVTLTNSNSGDSTNLFLTASEDEYATFRADNVPTRYDRNVGYNYFINGTVISDFTYSKVSGGYNFKMNAYNQRYSLGVVEVFNSEGKIIQVEKINKFEATGTSIVKTFKSGWYLIEDAWNHNLLTFKGREIAKETAIDVFVPNGGFVRISNDSAASTTCFLANLFDAVLTAGGIIKNTSSLSASQVDLVTKTAIAKFIGNTYYLETAKKFQEKMNKLVAENVSEALLLSLASQAAGIADELLTEIDLSFNDILKEALGTASSIGEKIFTQLTGTAGLALNILFFSQKCMNYVVQMTDWYKTTNKQGFMGIMTPRDAGYESGKIVSPDGISVDTNNAVDSETVLQTFRILKDDITINLDSKEIENDFVLYDISLVKDGNTVQPSKKVTVYVPLPSGFKDPVTVLRKNSDGSWAIIDAKVINKVIVFEVDHFCTFAFVSEMGTEEPNPVVTVRKPSITTIKYGNSIILHADMDEQLPDGARIEWTASNGNFDMRASEDGTTCKISPKSSGKTEFTATIYDKDGNVISSDTQEMTSKAGLWQKIMAFFRKIFGLAKIFPQAFDDEY